MVILQEQLDLSTLDISCESHIPSIIQFNSAFPPHSPMSEIDGVLTTQLSMTSLMSTNSITSAPSMDIEKQMFDDTLNKAYKSSTFQR